MKLTHTSTAWGECNRLLTAKLRHLGGLRFDYPYSNFNQCRDRRKGYDIPGTIVTIAELKDWCNTAIALVVTLESQHGWLHDLERRKRFCVAVVLSFVLGGDEAKERKTLDNLLMYGKNGDDVLDMVMEWLARTMKDIERVYSVTDIRTEFENLALHRING